LVHTLDAALDIGLPYLRTNPRRPGAAALAKMSAAALRHWRGLGKIPSVFITSVAQTIDERFRHPAVRDAIAAQCGVVSSIANEGSGLLLLFFPFYHRFGAHRVVGGTQGLPDALASALRAAGGSIRTHAVVDEILVAGGRAVGVRLEDGEELTARRGLIATCDPRTALGALLAPGTLEPGIEARVAHIPAWGDGWGDLKVDMALSGQLRLSRHQKQRGDGLDLRRPAAFIGGYEQALRSYPQSRMGQVPTEVGMWTVVPTAVDPSQAPAGQDTLHLWANPMPLDPQVPWEDATKAVVAHAAEFYDGVEELEIGRFVENPTDRARRMRATNGCLYHTDMTLFRMGPCRPAPGLAGYRTPVTGLYLGGAGSHPAAAVTGLPGRLSAKELLRDRSARR
jgi:phytoene dehydrogenase-like protein